MKYISRIILAIIVMGMFFSSCKKEGPQGPAGPEGPKGNPGPDGALIGTNAGGVLAYSLMERVADDAALFRWARQTFLPVGNYFMETRFDKDSPWNDALNLKGDTAGILSQGIALVYLYGNYTSGGADHWFSLPHAIKLTTNLRQFYTHTFWINDAPGADELHASIRVQNFCEQVSSTSNTSPIYNIDGIRIIVIGAGSSGVLTGRYRDVPDEQLSLKEAMEKYGLKESDFRSL